MPKSKRDKKVSLTKTVSKGREAKIELVNKLRDTVDEFSHLYVFSFENMRSSKFKDLRIEFRDSRFFLGKNKVLQKAFGMLPEDEYRDNLRHLSKRLVGQVGVFATNRPEDEVMSFFESFKASDFAKAGFLAPRTVVLDPSEQPLQWFPITMFELFRKLGLNIEIKDGKILMLEPFTVCTEGKAVTPEQAKLMTHLDIQLVEFKIQLLCCWSDGEFKNLDK